jgi:hypothetical protein
MTRHETLEKINHHLEHWETKKLEQLLENLEVQTLEILPGRGGKIGRHKPVLVKSKTGSEQIIREARDNRQSKL